MIYESALLSSGTGGGEGLPCAMLRYRLLQAGHARRWSSTAVAASRLSRNSARACRSTSVGCSSAIPLRRSQPAQLYRPYPKTGPGRSARTLPLKRPGAQTRHAPLRHELSWSVLIYVWIGSDPSDFDAKHRCHRQASWAAYVDNWDTERIVGASRRRVRGWLAQHRGIGRWPRDRLNHQQ